MSRPVLSVILAFGVLAGCVGAPAKPHYTEDILVANRGWWKYWSFNPKYLRMAWPGVSGCFLYQAIIDSDGYPFDGKLLAYGGPPEMADAAKKLIALQHFMPTDANPHRTPVKAIFALSFQSDPTDPHHQVRHPPGGYEPSPAYVAVIKRCTDALDMQYPPDPVAAPVAATVAHG